MKRISNQTNPHPSNILTPAHKGNLKTVPAAIKLGTLFHEYCQDNNSQYVISMRRGYIVNVNNHPGGHDKNNQIWNLRSKQVDQSHANSGGPINTNIRRAQNSLFSNLISKLSTKQNKQKSKVKGIGSHLNPSPITDKPHVSKSPLRRVKHSDTNSHKNIKNNIMGNILQARNISPKHQTDNLPLDSCAKASKNLNSHKSQKSQQSNHIKTNSHPNNVINIQNIECIKSQYGSNIKQSHPSLNNNAIQTQNIAGQAKSNSHTSYNIINKIPPTYPHPNTFKNQNNIRILQNKNEVDLPHGDQSKLPTHTQSYNVDFSFQNADNFQPVHSAHPKIYSGESFSLAGFQNMKNQTLKEYKQCPVNINNLGLNKNKQSIIQSLINHQKEQKEVQNKVAVIEAQVLKHKSPLSMIKTPQKDIKQDSAIKTKEIPIPINIDINLCNKKSQNEEVYQNVKNPYVSLHQTDKQTEKPPNKSKIQEKAQKKEVSKQAQKKLTDQQVCQIISSRKRSVIANNASAPNNQQKELLNMSDLDIDVLLKMEPVVQHNVQVKPEANSVVAKNNLDNESKVKGEDMIKRIVLNVSEKQVRLNPIQIPKTITFPEIPLPSPIITIKKPNISRIETAPLTIPATPQLNRCQGEIQTLITSFVPHYYLTQLTPSVSSPRAFENFNSSHRFSNGFEKGINQAGKPTESVYQENRLSEPSQQKSSLLFELSANSNL